MEVRLAYARVSNRTQEIQSQIDALEAASVHRLFQEQISTRVRERPEMTAALAAAREYRSLGAKVTLVVARDEATGPRHPGTPQGRRGTAGRGDRAGVPPRPAGRQARPSQPRSRPVRFLLRHGGVRTRLRDKTLEGQEIARTKGKAIGGVKVSDEDTLATALRLRDDERLSLREITSRLVIRTGKKRGRHPAPATVMRMLREHDERTTTATLEPTA